MSRSPKLFLAGAFIVGGIYGAYMNGQPWRGEGIIANVAAFAGAGLGASIIALFVIGIEVIIKMATSLIRRKRNSN